MARTSSLREITHITFPAEVCYPYSLLELYAYRLLPLFTLSYNINKHKDDPFERFLWFLRLVIFQCLPVVIGMESKKPFSPVICEHFVAWMKHSPDNYTEFFAEQVSHNPDITYVFHFRDNCYYFYLFEILLLLLGELIMSDLNSLHLKVYR